MGEFPSNRLFQKRREMEAMVFSRTFASFGAYGGSLFQIPV